MKFVRFFCICFFIFIPLTSVNTIDPYQKVVCLTFDDGPSIYTKDLVKLLNRYQASATFFIVGEKIHTNKQLLKQMIKEGHEIGNHTYSHKWLTKQKESTIISEINKTTQDAYQYLHYKLKYFRPAYGAINQKVKSSTNLQVILWSIDGRDWKIKNSKTIAKNIIKNIKDGDIILLHDTYSRTVNAVSILLPLLKKEGYQFITISELFEVQKIRNYNG